MARKYTENKPKIQTPMPEETLNFYQLTLRAAKEYGDLKFVMEDEFKNMIHVCITEEGIAFNGHMKDSRQARNMIADNRAEFRRMFIEAIKRKVSISKIMPALYLTSLLDVSAATKKTADMALNGPAGKHELHIEHRDGMPKLMIDKKEATIEEAEKLVKENYTDFLVKIKSANRAMTKVKTQNELIKQYRRKRNTRVPDVKHSELRDGKVVVDISSFFKQPTGNGKEFKKRSVIQSPKRGYVEE